MIDTLQWGALSPLSNSHRFASKRRLLGRSRWNRLRLLVGIKNLTDRVSFPSSFLKRSESIREDRVKQMEWRVFLSTFGVIFLAEMGDKTQLAAMTMAAESKRPWAVFLGASLALVAVSALGVLIGGAIGNYIPIVWIKRIAAISFIVIGILILMDKF